LVHNNGDSAESLGVVIDGDGGAVGAGHVLAGPGAGSEGLSQSGGVFVIQGDVVLELGLRVVGVLLGVLDGVDVLDDRGQAEVEFPDRIARVDNVLAALGGHSENH